MTIKELKEYVDAAYTNGEQASVEFWLNLKNGSSIELYVDSIGQFNIIPDMIMELRPMNEDEDISKER